MPNQADSGFSFDLYRGLNAELNEAYARNRVQGIVFPETITTAGIAAAIRNALRHSRSDILRMTAEVQMWAKPELDTAAEKWERYNGLILDHFDKNDIYGWSDPNFNATMNRLYEAKLALDASPETTPLGEHIGKTMHLVAVPWQAFRATLDDFPKWINHGRRRQGIYTDDAIVSDLVRVLKSDTPLYRNPHFSANNTTVTAWLSAKEYLDQRIAIDGPWGIILVQTSHEAGVAGWRGQSPDDLTGQGTCTPLLEGQPVGGMGIFEWLALTLQETPSELSPSDSSWFLANRMEGKDSGVPWGCWRGQVKVYAGWPDCQDESVLPRLAVI